MIRSKINLGYIVLIVTMVLLGLTSPALADGIIIIDPPPDVPMPHLDEALTIKYHHVNVTIKDQIATTRVDQVFYNHNPWPAEGTYIFPLPKGAAVSDFVMWDGGEPLRGEILEAEEARAIYNDIVRRMEDPALLEYIDQSTLKASIFPIQPGEERRIELEYSEVLPMEGGLVRYIYPLGTERFSASPLESVAIRAEVTSDVPIKAVYSPSHEVSIDRDDDYHALLGHEESDVLPESDFELYYTVSPDLVGLNLLSYKEPGEDGFFMLLAAPKVEVDPDEIVAKDVILVLDVSGSMDGEKIAQAKDAAEYILDNLNPEDRFNIIAFSTATRTFSAEMEPASASESGIDFVRGVEASGSTDINRALLEALAIADETRPTTLIFLTDGLPTEGVRDTSYILRNVKEAAPENVRLFSFGVGYDVDADLLDQLSLDQGGSSSYVRPEERIDEAVSAFYNKIKTPVLSDIEIDFGDVAVDQLFPKELPDLFAGTQLLVVGRYTEGGPATITLSGKVNDEKVSFVYQKNKFTNDGGDEFIPRLWAIRAIGYYLTQIRLYGEVSEWVEMIVDLSTRYGIITPYTSFLIDESRYSSFLSDDGDIFTETGRESVALDAEAMMADEAALPSYGERAVESAVYSGGMSKSISPVQTLPPSVLVSGTVEGLPEYVDREGVLKFVGSKTFVLTDDCWTDTAFEKDTMTPVEVGFLSDEYFDLIETYPDLGEYFALGEEVIVVYKGVAYQVV